MPTVQSYTKAAIDTLLATINSSISTINSTLLPLSNLGIKNHSVITANGPTIGSTETDGGISVTFTQVSGRRYLISFFGIILPSNANNIAAVRLTDNSNNSVAQTAVECPHTTYGIGCTLSYIYTAGFSGSVTYKIRLAMVVGTGTVRIGAGTTFPANLIVQDIGG